MKKILGILSIAVGFSIYVSLLFSLKVAILAALIILLVVGGFCLIFD